jgi:signal transduction histidine kinase
VEDISDEGKPFVAPDPTEAILRQSEDRLRRYGSRLIEMEESLRRSLATELHDEIGRDLTSLGLNLSAIRAGLPREETALLGPRFEDAQRLVVGISRAIRGLMARLRPPVLDDYGLPAALRWHTEPFLQRTGLEVCLQIAEPFPRLSREKEVTLFRIAQEALANAARHSGAGIVTVELRCSAGTVRLAIRDDGHGFDPEVVGASRAESGWGMTIMRERAASIEGRFEVRSSPDEGTCIMVEVAEGR